MVVHGEQSTQSEGQMTGGSVSGDTIPFFPPAVRKPKTGSDPAKPSLPR